MREEDIEAGEWEVNGRKQGHEPVVKDEEENPIREESNEDHEEFSVKPRKHQDVGIKDAFQTIQVEMKERGGEKDAKDGYECLFGEEEIRKHDVKGGEKCLIGDKEV